MLPLAYLMAGTLKEAVEYLAQRAAHVRTEGATYMEKKALGASDVLSSLGDTIQNNPILGKALLGAGLGAGVGAGAHMMDQDEEGKKRKGILNRMLTGGVAGAAIGGGAGIAQEHWPSGPPTGEQAVDAAKGTLSVGGQGFKMSPHILKNDPDLLAKVHELSTAPFYERWPSNLINFIINNPLAPTTTPWLATAGIADAALHSNTLRTGDWFGGRRLNLPFGLGSIGMPGMIDPKNSRNVKHMEAGIDTALASKEPHPLVGNARETLQNMRGDRPIELSPGANNAGPGQTVRGRDVLRRLAADPNSSLRSRATVNDTVVEHGTMPVHESREGYRDTDQGRQPYREDTHKEVPTRTERQVPRTVEQELTNAQRGGLAELGAGAHAGRNVANPALEGMRPTSEVNVRRGLRGNDDVLATGPFRGVRGVKRLLFYGGIPALEWGIRNYSRDVSKSWELRKLLQEARQRGDIKPIE